jgi:hypothetical protein
MGYIGNKPTAVPLTSADIQDGVITAADLGANSVDSSELVDNSVTLAKMAGLARGKLIYGDASGDPAALAVGGADEVLTHDGTDFDWAAASGGGLIYVGGNSTASNVAAVNLDNVFSGTYDNYLMVFDMTSNGNGDAILHFRSAGGSPATQTGANYKWAFTGLDTGGNSETSYGDNNSLWQMGHGMYDNQDGDYPMFSGYIYFNSPFSGSHTKSFNGNFMNRASDGDTRGFTGGGLFNNQTSCGGVRLSFSSDSVNNCTARMYGLVNS